MSYDDLRRAFNAGWVARTMGQSRRAWCFVHDEPEAARPDSDDVRQVCGNSKFWSEEYPNMSRARWDWCEVHESRRSQPSSALCLFATIYPAASSFCRFVLVEIMPVGSTPT